MTITTIRITSAERGVVWHAANKVASSSHCGSGGQRCANHWKCVQRQGKFASECPADLCTIK